MNIIVEDIIDVVQAAVNPAPVPIIVDLITDVSDVYYKGCKWEDIEDKPELYNKSEVDTLLNGKQDKGDYVTNSTLTNNYYNKTEVDTKIDNVTVDLSDYYNKEEVDEKIDNIDIPTYTAGTDTDITDNVISSTFNLKNRNTHVVRKDYTEPYLMGGKYNFVSAINPVIGTLYLTGNDTTYTFVNNYGYKDLSVLPIFLTNTQIHNQGNTISAKITAATCTDNVITITTDTTLGECNNSLFYFQIKVSGYNHLTMDSNSILNGYANIVGGYYNCVNGAGRNLVGGRGNLIYTYDSIIAGAYNEVVGRSWESVIAGDHNYNYGDKSLVIGDYNENVGDNHIMLGYKNKNSRYSYWSMLTGSENESNSAASLIVGEKNKLNSNSQDSIVGGYGNEATGARSVLFGTNNKTTKANEFAVGTYNKSESDTLFSIGNGTSDSARSNIFEVKNTNKAFINGNEVATTTYVDTKIGDINTILEAL